MAEVKTIMFKKLRQQNVSLSLSADIPAVPLSYLVRLLEQTFGSFHSRHSKLFIFLPLPSPNYLLNLLNYLVFRTIKALTPTLAPNTHTHMHTHYCFSHKHLCIDYSGLAISQAPNSAMAGSLAGGVGGTVASESALRSAGILLSWVLAPPKAPWRDGGPESLRSPYCGLAIDKNKNKPTQPRLTLTDA
ncbi:hypothetical protein PoB_005082400 [Plakobranchus ocellatus]|uniref:Uncharacterized protein n=1 Tax=Plakobranchus ocellatus TaxID=259542 RepID=A0AAV4BVU7_9GAST|nr:hypothetical protein PoB_005082400 [Plakobranchus ocellatus]